MIKELVCSEEIKKQEIQYQNVPSIMSSNGDFPYLFKVS